MANFLLGCGGSILVLNLILSKVDESDMVGHFVLALIGALFFVGGAIVREIARGR